MRVRTPGRRWFDDPQRDRRAKEEEVRRQSEPWRRYVRITIAPGIHYDDAKP